jgi:hypothetical protein
MTIGRGYWEIPPKCHFVHHEYYMTWLCVESGRLGEKPPSDRLRYGKGACCCCCCCCCYYHFPVVRKLSLLFYVKWDVTFLHFFRFRSIMDLNPALPYWKMLVFVFLLAVLGTPQSLVLVPPINPVLLLGAPALSLWWMQIWIYLQSDRFLSITFYNLLSVLSSSFFISLHICFFFCLFLLY